MTLIKTSALSLVATLFKVSYGLVITKLLAVYEGATGVAFIGQFQNIQAAFTGIATAGFGQGLTKYLAEFKQDAKKSQGVFATAVKLVCLLLVPVSFVLFLFSGELSEFLFDSRDYKIWIQGLGVSLVPASIGALFLAALNGFGEVRYLTLVGVFSSCLGIALAFFLVPLFGLSGMIIALLSTPFLVLLMAAWYLHRSQFFSWDWLQASVNRSDSMRLGKFTLMALASAITIPVSQILIRNHLGESISLDAAGLWTGMWRISEAYLMVVTMTLSVYYLPKLSSLIDKNDLIQEMRYGYKMIMPFVLLSSIVVFLIRDWLILLLFNDSFLAMRDLFLWQLVGDFIKMACFLMGFILLAKGLATVFIVKEIVMGVLFVLFTYLFVGVNGLVGVTHAYVAVYVVNFLWLVLIMRRYFFSLHSNHEQL